MGIIQKLQIRFVSWRDARYGVYLCEESFVAAHGKRPNPNPGELERLKKHLDRVSDRVETRRAAVDRHADETRQHLPLSGLLLLASGTFLVEAFAALRVLRSLGTASHERLLLGLMLAIAIVGATSALRWSLEKANSRPGMTQIGTAILMLLQYTGLFVAIASVRFAELDALALEGVALYGPVAITLSLTIGPGWLLDWVLRRVAAQLPIVRQLRAERRALLRLEKERKQLVAELEHARSAQTAWLSKAEKHRAAYDATWQLAADPAKLGQVPSTRWPDSDHEDDEDEDEDDPPMPPAQTHDEEPAASRLGGRRPVELPAAGTAPSGPQVVNDDVHDEESSELSRDRDSIERAAAR